MTEPEDNISNSDIERAKAHAKGGKPKRCTRGKACSAACIERGDVCLVVLPSSPSESLPKARTLINKAKAEKPKTSLPSLTNSKQFEDRLKSSDLKTNLLGQQARSEIKVLKKVDENKENPFIKKLIAAVGSIDKLKTMLGHIRDFTGDDYKGIRAVMKLKGLVRGENDPLPRHLKGKTAEQIKRLSQKATSIERLLKQLPKPEIEKFRGLATDSEHLASLIKQAKSKGTHTPSTLNSWSISLKEAKQFADDGAKFGGREHRILFHTVNKKGSYIDPLSERPDERELLTPSKAKFKFIGHNKIEHSGHTYHVFEVMES